MDHFVYILKSVKDQGYYIGYTTDLENRIYTHNEGLTKSTKGRRPLIMICHKLFESKKDALDYEKHLKSTKGSREKIEWIKANDSSHRYY